MKPVRAWAWPAAVFGLAGCSGGVLDAQGPIAGAEQTIMLDSLVIMLAIVVPTLLATLAFAWWFRQSNTRARYRPDFVYSGRIEVLVWSVPLLVITFLGGLIWVGSHQLDPYRPLDSKVPPINVQAISLDWKWLFIFPDQGVASVNALPIPAGTPIHFSLTSASVMNTISIPQLSGMIYLMNDMVTQINMAANHPGHFMGLSGMFSGDGFSDMNFDVQAMPRGNWDRWVAGARGHGPSLDRAAYADLAKQSMHVTPFTYGAVQAGLFDDVSTQKIPPGAGPAEGRGGSGVHPKPEG